MERMRNEEIPTVVFVCNPVGKIQEDYSRIGKIFFLI
jgi:hypothetical protein